MHSLYHLERLSRETPAERVRQAERDEVGRRARRAQQPEDARRTGWQRCWLALLGWAKSSARRRPSVEFDR